MIENIVLACLIAGSQGNFNSTHNAYSQMPVTIPVVKERFFIKKEEGPDITSYLPMEGDSKEEGQDKQLHPTTEYRMIPFCSCNGAGGSRMKSVVSA